MLYIKVVRKVYITYVHTYSMKVNKTITLDADVFKKLDKIKNASEYINDLLKKYLFAPKKSIEEQLKEIQNAN